MIRSRWCAEKSNYAITDHLKSKHLPYRERAELRTSWDWVWPPSWLGLKVSLKRKHSPWRAKITPRKIWSRSSLRNVRNVFHQKLDNDEWRYMRKLRNTTDSQIHYSENPPTVTETWKSTESVYKTLYRVNKTFFYIQCRTQFLTQEEETDSQNVNNQDWQIRCTS